MHSMYETGNVMCVPESVPFHTERQNLIASVNDFNTARANCVLISINEIFI